MSNQTDYLAGNVFSRPTECRSTCEGSTLAVPHPSAPTEEETHISESASKNWTSGEVEGFPQSSIADTSAIRDAPTHSWSGGGLVGFLLLNPSSNDVDAQDVSTIHKFRPRTRQFNADSLDVCLENELKGFRQFYQSSCSVRVCEGVNADSSNMIVITGTSRDRHSHGARPPVEQCHPSSIGGIQVSSLTNDQSHRGGLGSLAQLFPDCDSFKDEWVGVPINFKMKPIHPHVDPYATFHMVFHAMNGSMDSHQQVTPLTPC
jgi:hypothetical protein